MLIMRITFINRHFNDHSYNKKLMRDYLYSGLIVKQFTLTLIFAP